MCADVTPGTSSPSTVHMGPCTSTAGPPGSVDQTITGFAGITGTAGEYLTDNTKIDVINTLYSPFVGRRESSSGVTCAAGWTCTGSFAKIEEGVAVGTSTAGGYLGSGYYLATSALTYKDNTFKYRTPSAAAAEAIICVTGQTDVASCVAKSAAAGQYKFSLFGTTWGGSLAAWAAGKNLLGYRVLACAKGTAAAFTFNGGTTLANLGTTQVSSINVNGADGISGLAYTFPTPYYYGTTASATATGTGTVKIWASAATTTAGANACINLDYGFDIAHVPANGWFVYDPTVCSGSACSPGARLAPMLIGIAAAATGALLL